MKIELQYLGFVVAKVTLKMVPSKVESTLSWPTPKSIVEVRCFH